MVRPSVVGPGVWVLNLRAVGLSAVTVRVPRCF